MKKILYSMFAMALSVMTFTSCEDVPMPFNLPSAEVTPDTPSAEATGSGTQDDPYNVAAALALIKAQEGETETAPIYVKGQVVKIAQVETAQYGNANYYIADSESGDQLYIYQSMYLGGAKFTSEDQLKVGDEVVVYGKFYNYKGNTPETVGRGSSSLYSLNGQTASVPDQPSTTLKGEAKGDGTQTNPYNSVAALQKAIAMADGDKEENVFVKGKVTKVTIDTSYGNATYYVADDAESSELEIFRGYYFNGAKFTSTSQLKVGDEVVLQGTLINYKGNTPEVTQGSKLISINGATEGTATDDSQKTDDGTKTDGTVDGKSISLAVSDLGLGNATEMTTITLSDGTTITFDAGGNSSTPKFYTTGGGTVRMYPNNNFTVNSSKSIVSVEITVDEYNGTTYNASGDITVEPGTLSVDGTSIVVTGINATTFKLANASSQTGGASQVRIKTIKITYAE